MGNVNFPNTELPDVISLRGVTQRYGQRTVLNELDLLIKDKPGQGEFIVLLGISGSGKSTILRYLNGLQKPTSGEVLIKGKPVSEYGAVSTVFQDYSSLPWRTVLENVELPLDLKGVEKKERRERALEMVARVGLRGHEHKYAQAPTLSGGQLQRVAIARSLIANPEIILMDEPFGALDGITRFEMQQLLANLWMTSQPAIVFVTHDEREAVFLGDDIYVLDPRTGKLCPPIHVDLPLQRDLSTKRDPRFMELVTQVDMALMETSLPLKK